MKFVDFLYRVKQELDFKYDKDVAAFLGLDEKAFSARKRRDSIPEKDLRAALARHPEIKADVDYILTGGRSIVDKSTNSPMISTLQELTDEEQKLIAYFREATAKDKEMIMYIAHRAEKKADTIETGKVG